MIWSDFKAAVLLDLPVDSQRIGIATGNPNYLLQQLLYAVIQVQKLVPFYQTGHETVYGANDLVVDGFASVGTFPQDQQCKPLDAYYRKVGKQCVSQPLHIYDWGNRQDLVCGNPRITSCQFFMAIDPWGLQFIVFPAVTDQHQISLTWAGVKTAFNDPDATPFEIDVAECVGLFCKAKIARMVDHDINEYASYFNEWVRTRSLLYADTKERSRFRLTESSAQPSVKCANSLSTCTDRGAICGNADRQHEDTVEFCAFGDSSDVVMDNTLAVSTLVKSLEPDFVMHMGDCNYPHGDPVTIQDNLIKYYGLYIPDDFYLSFGNHDIETDGGAALEKLLSVQNGLNSGKKYYDFIPGRFGHQYAHIFVLDGNDPNGVQNGSEQWLWLEPLLASSDMWNIVVVHQPPFSSDLVHYPGYAPMQRDWENSGAHLMIAGHGHNYERISMNGFPLLICGLGGATKRGFHNPPVIGSQFRYNTFYGSLYITARKTRLQASFFDTRGVNIDSIAMVNEAFAAVP